ncbi:MAG TPA: SlyX family protein [Rhodanobacteraceae bacterium]|nr:SlyX family protein [Rhodanobacteraceae bacterium]
MSEPVDLAGLEQRLAEVEIRLAFVDDAVAALARADTDRERRLLALERTLDDMRAELQSMRLAMGHSAQDEPPPPHY